MNKILAKAAIALAIVTGSAGMVTTASATDTASVTITLPTYDRRIVQCNVFHGMSPTEASTALVRQWASVRCPVGAVISGGIYIYRNGMQVGYTPIAGVGAANAVAHAPCVRGGRFTAAIVVRVAYPGALPAAGPYWTPIALVPDCVV